MAQQLILEALSGGVTSIDNQTALAVQSLLDSQNVADTISVDDDDLFQCGKCKKEFTNLLNFLSHKQNPCMGGDAVGCGNSANCQSVNLQSTIDIGNTNASIVYTTHLGPALSKQLNAFEGVSVSSLVPGMVLGDEIISFHAIDPSSSISLGSTIQGGSYLSQVEQMTLNVKNPSVSIYGSVGESVSYGATTNDFAGVIDGSQLHFQHVMGPSESQMELQQVIISVPQSEPMVEALFSPQNALPSSDGLKPVAHVDGITSVNDSNGLSSLNGKLPLKAIPASPADEGSRKKLKCQYCDKSFMKNFDLQQHLRSHTGEKPFQCIVCGRAFAQKSNVKKHMQTHKVWPQGLNNTLPSPLIVPVMVKSDSPGSAAAIGGILPTTSYANDNLSPTNNASFDNEIIQQNNINISLNCDSNSSAQFVKQWPAVMNVQQDAVQDGDRLNVVVDNSYICQYCGTKFGSYFQLKSHMVMHKNEQVYKCVLKTCGECFRELDEFLEHTKIHENELTYRCSVCNKTFGSLYELGTHQYSHSLYPNLGPKPGPKYFRCVKCNNKYASPEALQHHLETTSHSFPCPYCTKVFACERYLRRHLPTHGTIGEYVCDICSKHFKTEHYLKMHMVIHSDEKPFHCDKCSTSFNRRDKLKRHLLIHDPVKKYKCPFRSLGGCMKEFNRADKLKSHIISHSGIKPYKCKICNKPFTRRPHLREHEQTHTNSFQHKCGHCGKGFRRQKLLQEHICESLGKDSSSQISSVGSKDTDNRHVSEIKGTARKKFFTSKMTLPKRGRPPKQITNASDILKPESQTSDAESVSTLPANAPVSILSVDGKQLDCQECDRIDTDNNIQMLKGADSESVAITGMITINPPPVSSGNCIRMDQALLSGGGIGLQGCLDGSVMTLEQAPDGTYYVIQPFLGKVEELTSQCFVDSVSSSEESVRRTLLDHITLMKGTGLGQTALVVNEMPSGHVAKAELADGLCQVIFTDEGAV